MDLAAGVHRTMAARERNYLCSAEIQRQTMRFRSDFEYLWHGCIGHWSIFSALGLGVDLHRWYESDHFRSQPSGDRHLGRRLGGRRAAKIAQGAYVAGCYPLYPSNHL